MNVIPLEGVAARGLPGCDRQGRDLLLVFASTTFPLPAAGRSHPAAPPLAEDQLPLLTENLYAGETGLSTLLAEVQTAYKRLGTDIHVIGQAWAANQRPVTEIQVGLKVGPCQRSAVVFGERRWTRRMSPGQPAPLVSLPLVWEHAYGGDVPGQPKKMIAQNPIGRGTHASAEMAAGELMPAIEDPARPMRSPGDRPAPVGFALVAPGWKPRSDYGGTYDETWEQTRAPLWPEDFDERFFQSAAPGLTAPGFLQGGEPVVLIGMSPDRHIAFPLPSVRLVVETEFQRRRDRRAPVLDVITIDTDAGVLTMIWRATIEAHAELEEHHVSYVRHLKPDEALELV